jgi:hypothetical protein
MVARRGFSKIPVLWAHLRYVHIYYTAILQERTF